MQDIIRREILINASQQKIYEAIIDPNQITKWFPETVEGDLKPGSQPIFGWGEHGKNQLLIVDAKPFEYFAYRWVPGANHFLGDVKRVATTLVEFKITKQSSQSCKVVMTESGFKDLPIEMMEAAFKQNTNGWEFMMGRLEQYLTE